MVYRTSRRRFIASAASLGALLTLPPAPVVAAPAKSDALRHAEYLVTLIEQWERKAQAGTPAERQHAIRLLESVDRCLDLPTDCLDGSFARRISAA